MGQTLSSTITEKVHCMEGEDERLKYAASSMQGWRITMEDAHTAVLNLNETKENAPHVSFFGVYDGHGGTAVSIYAGEHLHTTIAATEEFQKGNYEAAMKSGFLGLDHEISQGASFQTDVSGCTACTCLITDNWDCIISNAGDSRAVLSRGGRAVPLSVDHKPLNPKENERITKAGGFVQLGRVNGNLALSRALGDLDFKKNTALPPEEQAVTADPEVFKYPLIDEDEFIIIACDGIWDCLNNQEVIDFVRLKYVQHKNLLTVCNELMHHCLADDVEMDSVGCDNMTVMIVALVKNRKEENLIQGIQKDIESRHISMPLPHMVNDAEKEEESEGDQTEPESDDGAGSGSGAGDSPNDQILKAVQDALAKEYQEEYPDEEEDTKQ